MSSFPAHSKIVVHTEVLQSVAINMSLPNKEIYINSFYDPQGKAPISDYTEIYSFRKEYFILCGDANAHQPMFGDQMPDKQGIAIFNWCNDKQDLICLNTGVPTRMGYSRQRDTCIDIALTSMNFFPESSFETLQSIGSDHLPIQIKFKDKHILQTDQTMRFNYKRADWNEFRTILENVQIQSQSLQSLNITNKFLSETIIQTAKRTIPFKPPAPLFGPPTPLWWNEACSKARQKALSSRNRWRRTRLSYDQTILKKNWALYRFAIRKAN